MNIHNKHIIMRFFQEYTVLDPSGQELISFRVFGPSGNKLKLVLQDLKLYIPAKNSR